MCGGLAVEGACHVSNIDFDRLKGRGEGCLQMLKEEMVWASVLTRYTGMW